MADFAKFGDDLFENGNQPYSRGSNRVHGFIGAWMII